MRTITFLFLFTLLATSLSAQVSIGANIHLGIPNKITQTGYGLEGFLEIKLTEEISARMTGGIHHASFEKEGIYDNSLTQDKIYGLIIYHPFTNRIEQLNGLEPYFGLGLGYFSSSYSSTHNAQIVNGGYIFGLNIKDAIGYCFAAGIDFSPLASFHVKAEANYFYINPDYSYTFENPTTFKIEDKIDLSYIACKLLFVIELWVN